MIDAVLVTIDNVPKKGNESAGFVVKASNSFRSDLSMHLSSIVDLISLVLCSHDVRADCQSISECKRRRLNVRNPFFAVVLCQSN